MLSKYIESKTNIHAFLKIILWNQNQTIVSCYLKKFYELNITSIIGCSPKLHLFENAEFYKLFQFACGI